MTVQAIVARADGVEGVLEVGPGVGALRVSERR